MKLPTNTKCGKLREKERERKLSECDREKILSISVSRLGPQSNNGEKVDLFTQCSQMSIVVAGCHTFLVRFETKKTLTLCYLVSCVYHISTCSSPVVRYVEWIGALTIQTCGRLASRLHTYYPHKKKHIHTRTNTSFLLHPVVFRLTSNSVMIGYGVS